MKDYAYPGVDFSHYERVICKDVDCYMNGLNAFTLLVSKKPIKQDESMLAQFFEPSLLFAKFDKQVVNVKAFNQAKKFLFHKFKMIEI